VSRRFEVASAAVLFLLSLSVAGCSLSEPTQNGASAAVMSAEAADITAVPFDVSDQLMDRIAEVQAACQCFTSLTAWSVVPVSPAGDVFASDSLLEALIGQDIQLPWVAAGEIDPLALDNLLGSQAGLIDDIAAAADPSGGDFQLGAHVWSHPTQPDFCSGETLYLMYFPDTGVLFAFRFDSSHEC